MTNTNVVWKLTRQVGSSPSPVLFEGRIYLVTNRGVATCVEAETGKVIWQHRLGGDFSASVVELGGHIYFFFERRGQNHRHPSRSGIPPDRNQRIRRPHLRHAGRARPLPHPANRHAPLPHRSLVRDRSAPRRTTAGPGRRKVKILSVGASNRRDWDGSPLSNSRPAEENPARASIVMSRSDSNSALCLPNGVLRKPQGAAFVHKSHIF